MSEELKDWFKARHGLEEYIRPLPCVRDEHGEIREQTVKRLFAKIDEELNELKIAVIQEAMIDSDEKLDAIVEPVKYCPLPKFAEEAADTITAITTMLEALGIDADMRDDAQRRVNGRNRERGRL